MKTALVLIDIQNDYFPGGNMELVGIENAATKAQKILQRFRDQKAPIFHIQHISAHPQSKFMLPNTKGVEINEKVAAGPGEPVIEKYFPSCFRDTSLLEQLKNQKIKELVICGAMSHMCIDTSVRAAFDLGFSCTVIEDACATRDLQFKEESIEASKVHAAFMSALSFPFAKVVSTDTYLK